MLIFVGDGEVNEFPHDDECVIWVSKCLDQWLYKDTLLGLALMVNKKPQTGPGANSTTWKLPGVTIAPKVPHKYKSDKSHDKHSGAGG